jgi:protease I
MKDWGHPVKVDRELADVSADNYDAIVLPGGQINPDLLRIIQDALRFIRAFYDQKKVVAAVCHAPWLLIEIGIIKGRDDHLLLLDQDRRDQCRSQVAGFGGGS